MVRDVLTIRQSKLGMQHRDVFVQVAEGLRGRGDVNESEALYREALMFGQNEGAACATIVERAQRGLDELLK